jgi:hypothetical protein
LTLAPRCEDPRASRCVTLYWTFVWESAEAVAPTAARTTDMPTFDAQVGPVNFMAMLLSYGELPMDISRIGVAIATRIFTSLFYLATESLSAQV